MDRLQYARPIAQLLAAALAFQFAGDAIDRITPTQDIDVKQLDVGFDPEAMHVDPDTFALLVRLKDFRKLAEGKDDDHYLEIVKYADRILHSTTNANNTKDKSKADSNYKNLKHHLAAMRQELRHVDAEVLVKFEEMEAALTKKINEHVEQIYRIASR